LYDSLEPRPPPRSTGRLCARAGIVCFAARTCGTSVRPNDVRVPVPDGRIDAAAADLVAAAFHRAHRAVYGYTSSATKANR
jgi:hypothetical protein